MRLPLFAALLAMTLLAACGGFRESNFNPLNWFGKSEPAAALLLQGPVPDARPLIDQVLSMSVEAYPGGAIIRASGLPPSQGWWDAELVALPIAEDGVLVYEFRVFPPVVRKPAGSQPSREITVAATLSDIKLEGIRRIEVQGAQNARAVNR